MGASDEDRPGPQTQRFDHVGAGADAAVHQHLDLAVHRGHDLRQDADGGGHGVELARAVVRHHDGVRARIDGAAGVFADVHAFDHDGTLPGFLDPVEVAPRDHGLLERRGDVGVAHGPVLQDDVREVHQTAVHEPVDEPPRPGQHLPEVGEHGEGVPGQKFLRAVPRIALAHSRHRRVDGDDERLVARGLRAFDGGERHIVPAHEIKLIPGGPGGRGLHVLESAARQRGQRVEGPCLARGPRRRFLAARVEHPAASDGRQDEGKVELRPKDGG
jgi:hypothetical protein